MQFTRRSKQLRCLSEQLVATGALAREANPPRRSALIGASIMFTAILVALTTIVSVARGGGCNSTPAAAPARR